MREQPNIFAAPITLGTAATPFENLPLEKPSSANFGVQVGLVHRLHGRNM